MDARIARKLLPLTALAAGVILGISLINAYVSAKHLARDIRNAGYSNVQQQGAFTTRTTAAVHGCTIGFDHTDTSDGPRVINGHEVHPFNISLVSASGTWTSIFMDNTTPTPDELSAYLGQHRKIYPCYRP